MKIISIKQLTLGILFILGLSLVFSQSIFQKQDHLRFKEAPPGSPFLYQNINKDFNIYLGSRGNRLPKLRFEQDKSSTEAENKTISATIYSNLLENTASLNVYALVNVSLRGNVNLRGKVRLGGN